MTVAFHGYVSGRVQGVNFRAATRREAEQLGLGGYARNLPDGRVEVLVVGEEGAARRLVDWLHRGPPLARVDAVDIRPVAVPSALPAAFSRE